MVAHPSSEQTYDCLILFYSRFSYLLDLQASDGSQHLLLLSGVFVFLSNKMKKNCNFRDYPVEQCSYIVLHDAFISGLSSLSIRQQLLENRILDLQTLFMQALSLDLAQQNNELYTTLGAQLATLVNLELQNVVYEPSVTLEEQALVAAYQAKRKCFLCMFSYHSPDHCPTRVATCKKCSKKGHYACACRSKTLLATMADPYVLTLFPNLP